MMIWNVTWHHQKVSFCLLKDRHERYYQLVTIQVVKQKGRLANHHSQSTVENVCINLGMKESTILMGILVFLFITGCTYAKYLLVEIDEPSNISGRGTIDDPLQGLINNRNSKCADLVCIINSRFHTFFWIHNKFNLFS